MSTGVLFALAFWFGTMALEGAMAIKLENKKERQRNKQKNTSQASAPTELIEPSKNSLQYWYLRFQQERAKNSIKDLD